MIRCGIARCLRRKQIEESNSVYSQMFFELWPFRATVQLQPGGKSRLDAFTETNACNEAIGSHEDES